MAEFVEKAQPVAATVFKFYAAHEGSARGSLQPVVGSWISAVFERQLGV